MDHPWPTRFEITLEYPIFDLLPFGRLWYIKPDDVVAYAKFFSRSNGAVIRIYDDAGDVIEMHEHTGDFKEW
jgi:hypothetical protein